MSVRRRYSTPPESARSTTVGSLDRAGIIDSPGTSRPVADGPLIPAQPPGPDTTDGTGVWLCPASVGNRQQPVGKPAITAVMALHNRVGLMDASIEAVLAQDDPDFELLIIDDGSTDGSWESALDWAGRDRRIRTHRVPGRCGISVARNHGLALARGRYLATCDSDDLSHPSRFRLLREYLDEHPEVVGAGGRIRCFTDDPETDGWLPDWHFGLKDGRLPFSFAAGMLRTEAMRAFGGYNSRLPVAEDLDLAYKLATMGRLVELPELVMDYRVHPGNVSGDRRVRERANLRAQLQGLRTMNGRFSLRGYLVLGQSVGRVIASSLPQPPVVG